MFIRGSRGIRKVWKTFFLVSLALFFPPAGQGQQPAPPLRPLETIPLPGVEGRIDHLAIDEEGQRLFVAALGNNSLEVIDLRRGSRIRSISGLSEPQGVFYDSIHRRIYVSSGRDGTVRIYDADTFRPVGIVPFPGDADNLHFDEWTKRLYAGYGDGGLGILDMQTQKQVGDVKLSGHPEGFALEKESTRIFVNIPTRKRIAVVDRMQQTALADWSVVCADNFPMALDEAQQRLFIGCRTPPEVLVYDTETGRQTTAMTVGRDVDDLFFDASQKRLYASCGVGLAFVLAQDDPDRYRKVAEVKTRAGARTSLFVAETHRLYVAAPRNGRTPAGILVFEVGR